MHDVPAWVETMRGVVLAVVWTVLVLRIPALRRSGQRPVWAVLLVLAAGSLLIQAQMGAWVDEVTGVPKAGELAVTLIALTDFAVVWWFALTLRAVDRPTPAWLRRAPLGCALVTAGAAFAFFVLADEQDRYGEQAHGWWVAYALVWVGYGLVTAVGAAAVFWRYGLRMLSPTLRASMLLLALGTSAEVPYLVIRGLRWFDPDASPALALAGFWCSFARFVLVALGCSLAAIDPLRKASLFYYRRQRLFRLWRLLRQATPELLVVTPQSRLSDLLTFRNSWELLHQRVIDIRDSIIFLRDGWASEELLREAARHIQESELRERERLLATACWIEAARRDALAGEPRRHEEVHSGLLPEVHGSESTMPREITYLVRLYRFLSSRHVSEFAARIRQQPQDAASG
ncbi:hypothetical protein RCO28_10205 [Streptomyces sp. LHD-70]|uniref:DUF6545 domain-containing protein n=1 Tax=Streptomyces sp. LHD-70 TaxID=3072140 RepID=UPI00280EB3DE|nr:DUF6545 domain-containing protein [Streptomyces sp. LHD-70]MDQ8702859.1 hypothetical protein [Streptomyces sp. LHD-70]